MDEGVRECLNKYLTREITLKELTELASNGKDQGNSDWIAVYNYILGYEDRKYDEGILYNRIYAHVSRKKG